MAEIVNLRRARKVKARAERDKTAEANRIAHGTPKTLRKLTEAQEQQAKERLKGHRLEKDEADN